MGLCVYMSLSLDGGRLDYKPIHRDAKAGLVRKDCSQASHLKIFAILRYSRDNQEKQECMHDHGQEKEKGFQVCRINRK
jgi:hypothetical protein